MELEIYIKQAPQFNSQGVPIIFTGTNPANLTAVANGVLPANRQWQNFGNYLNVTDYCSDLFDLQLTWTAEIDDTGLVQGGETQSKKSASGKLTFEGEAFRLIKQWLYDDVSAPLNSVQVKILHVGCGGYEDYRINTEDITYCETDPMLCTFEVVLKQKDDALNCIKKTVISDNWKGWFQDRPANGKKHPRFSYCNEQRPNGMLVALWFVLSILGILITVVLFPVLVLIAGLIAIINGVISIINLIIDAVNTLPFVNINKIPLIPNFNPLNIFDSVAGIFIESAGCGREHPAPLIRDYITNVCEKCGVTVNETTAPLFFATNIAIETSSNGLENKHNPHYNACYLNAPVQRGIRRFSSIDLDGTAPNNTDYYLYENRPLLTLDEFLDQLKKLYNYEWIVVANNLYIYRKDKYVSSDYVYNFTANNPDRLKLLEGICYDWDGRKYPAYTEGLYTKDATDKPGNEMLQYMNSLQSYNNSYDNPNYEGKQDKTTEFGATKFRLDGASEDYLYDAFQTTLNLQFVTVIGAVFFIPIRNAIRDFMAEFLEYCLLIQGETVIQPKVLLWDGYSFDNAKAIKPHTAFAINPSVGQMPPPNAKYNSLPWFFKHTAQTKVIGQALTLSSFVPGYYTVSGFFGAFKIQTPAMLVNYPMYFEPGFAGTMWDWFHWIDDPQHNPRLNQTVVAKIELCCDDLQKLGVFGSAQNIVLGKKIKVNSPFYQDAKITEIEVNYNTDDESGMSITIKARL